MSDRHYHVLRQPAAAAPLSAPLPASVPVPPPADGSGDGPQRPAEPPAAEQLVQLRRQLSAEQLQRRRLLAELETERSAAAQQRLQVQRHRAAADRLQTQVRWDGMAGRRICVGAGWGITRAGGRRERKRQPWDTINLWNSLLGTFLGRWMIIVSATQASKLLVSFT